MTDTAPGPLTEDAQALAAKEEPKPLTQAKRFDLIEARLGELEDRAQRLEEAEANRPPEPPFDPTLYVRRDEVDTDAMRPRLEPIGKCELCSCERFWGEHPSGDPDLCLNCNHHVGVHQRQPA